MKKVLKNVKWFVFACCFSSILNVHIANAQELNKCSDWKDAEFCSTYNVITMLTADIREAKESAYIGQLAMIKIMHTAKSNINFYASFQLILALIDGQEDFFQSEDYYTWKRTLIFQLVEYQDKFGDKTRTQSYLYYLFYVVEPIEALQTSDLAPLIERRNLPENAMSFINCFVNYDIPYLSSDQVEKLDSYKTCIKSAASEPQQ